MTTVNEADSEWVEYDHGQHQFRRKQLAQDTPGDQLGCSLYEIPPDGRSWPYHYHTANEEAIFVLSGTGVVRADGHKHEITTGDFMQFPADESGGHQIRNSSTDPLRYLCISTMHEPDVTMYPDSDKFGVFVGAPPGDSPRTFEGFFPTDGSVPYWDDD